MHFRIGTRSSQLALWQAHHIADLLQSQGCTSSLVAYETKGDKQLETTIAKIGSKGVFTEELEQDLLADKIDLAIHSAKDLQSTMPLGLELIAFTERELAFDVVLSLDKQLDFNNPGLIVGSSSTRRRALLAKYYPNITPVEARGNLQTRLQKLKDGHFQAMILAYAGVHRMGFDDYVVHQFPIDQFVPPTGQGSIAVQCAASLSPAHKQLVRATCNHSDTELCLLTERAYLARLDGGCSIPVFAHATLQEDALRFHAGIISLDGQDYLDQVYQHSGLTTDLANEIGTKVAESVLSLGGGVILQTIRQTLART